MGEDDRFAGACGQRHAQTLVARVEEPELDLVAGLAAGLLLGPGALGWIDVAADSALNQIILIFGSCYILFDGGASLRFKVLKEVWLTITVLATAGVVITAVNSS